MNVVILNWAPIWRGAHLGGGVNGYLNALAPRLVKDGHEVTSIFAGLLHTEHPKGCFSRRHEDFQGVRVIEIINSPVLAPSSAQFREPMTEIHAPELESELGRLLSIIRPEIAHWHNLEGFSAGCIDVCRDAGAKVVYSLHNYHTLCSQVTLCQGHERPCTNFESGHACSTCIEAPDPFSERVRRQREYALGEDAHIGSIRRAYERSLSEFKHELSWPKRLLSRGIGVVRARSAWRQIRVASDSPRLPGKPVDNASDLEMTPALEGSERRVSLPVILSDRVDMTYAQRAGPPLSNAPQRDPSSGRLLGAHARRRARMIEMLNRCDRVLAVSDFVRLKYEAEGVNADLIATMRIGTIAAEHESSAIVRRRTGTGSHLRLVFLGYNHFNKGLPLLLTAMRGMSGEALRHVGLSIYAPGVQSIGPGFRELYPPLAELHIRDRYDTADLQRILSGNDLCYVGSTWWDPLPQTALEAIAFGTPVLGAEAGGIPEAVQDGVNGYLFRANDPASLRSRLEDAIELFARGEWPGVIEPPKTMAAHSTELCGLYQDLLCGASSGRIPRHSETRRRKDVSAARSTAPVGRHWPHTEAKLP